MSVWQTTTFIPSVQREMTMTILMPDWKTGETGRFDTTLFVAPDAYESNYLIRYTDLELSCCKQGNRAVVGLPGSITTMDPDGKMIKEHLIPFLSKLYPLNITGICYAYASEEKAILPIVSLEELKRNG